MIPFKIRKKILNKFAQAMPLDTPSEKFVNKNTNLGTPPSFTASDKYPALRTAFNSNAISIINNLSSYLNQALFYASDGNYTMSKLFSINFNFSPTMIPNVNRDLKFLVLFAKEVYNTIYNAGNKYIDLLKKEEYVNKINNLLQSQNLNNLSQTNPTGQLSIKMGGNIKTDIINFLRLLLNIAPTQ